MQVAMKEIVLKDHLTHCVDADPRNRPARHLVRALLDEVSDGRALDEVFHEDVLGAEVVARLWERDARVAREVRHEAVQIVRLPTHVHLPLQRLAEFVDGLRKRKPPRHGREPLDAARDAAQELQIRLDARARLGMHHLDSDAVAARDQRGAVDLGHAAGADGIAIQVEARSPSGNGGVECRFGVSPRVRAGAVLELAELVAESFGEAVVARGSPLGELDCRGPRALRRPDGVAPPELVEPGGLAR
mmetsp:Transcript_2781/g.8175  ORF Transcript_2781/g.8175 Transcript_2781/m.8175 type:complete len:246 (+) Transcript_2781:858-1595(+)